VRIQNPNAQTDNLLDNYRVGQTYRPQKNRGPVATQQSDKGVHHPDPTRSRSGFACKIQTRNLTAFWITIGSAKLIGRKKTEVRSQLSKVTKGFTIQIRRAPDLGSHAKSKRAT